MTTSADGLWRRLLLRRRFRALLQLAVLAAVAVSATFLLTPSQLTPQIPGDDSLGQIATASIRAPRDFDVRDQVLLAHETQVDPTSFWFACPVELQAKAWPTEDYQLARCQFEATTPEDDLFAGVREAALHEKGRS